MKTTDDFWLLIHSLANVLEFDDLPVPEKAEVLANFLQLYPQSARKQLEHEFRFINDVFSEILRRMPAAADSAK